MEKFTQMELIGQRVKSLRKSLGLSQERLAYAVGYQSRSSINKIELGKTDLSQSRIIDLATALNTTPQYLVYGDGENVSCFDGKIPIHDIKLSRALISIREKNGLSQSDLADMLGCSRSAIGMYETAQREPDINTLWTIADLFEVDIDHLVGRKSPETHHSEESSKSLCSKLRTVIEKSEVKYGEVIKTLSWLLCAYEDKGKDLLNGTSIQEVAAHEQHHSVKLP